MRKMRKLLAAVLAGAMLLGLAACGDDAKTDPTVQVSPTQWQTVADVDALDLVLDYTDGDYVAQIPQFKDADGNDVLTAMNKRLLEKGDQFKQIVASDGCFLQLIPMVRETDNYLSVVLHEQELPAYGTDGTVTSYVYDKATKSEVSEELAWSLSGATDDGVADAIKAYCENVLNNDGADWRWLSFETVGYYMDADGKMALVFTVAAKDKSVEDADTWNYLLIYKGGQIVERLD